MPSYTSPHTPRTGDVAGTLKLLAWLVLAIALIVLDHRGGWLAQLRQRAVAVVQPLWWVAGMPARIGDTLSETAATRNRLASENRVLRNALLVSGARVARLQAASAENAHLRELLGAARRNGGLDVQLAPVLDIDLDPTRQRLLLDAGTRDGVSLGQAVIDAGGLVGQIIAVQAGTATVLLLTDPDHAVPVMVARSGVRLLAYGSGRSDRLALANVPLSADVRIGDVVLTSGLGGRFPAGFPVGTIVALHPDDSHAFLVGDVRPAARLDRGRDVLLLREQPHPALPEPVPPQAAPSQAAKPGARPARAEAPR